jgi:transposase InsO family protein
MCRVLLVSRNGFYAYRRRPESEHARRDAELAEAIAEVFDEGRGHYGAPRVRKGLRHRGIYISKRRTARLLSEQGLRASKAPRRRVTTTDSRHDEPIAANVLDRDFSAEAPNQKWAGDITYIRTDEGWLYLAVFLDLFSRRVIGWAMSDRIDAALTQSALAMALLARSPKGPLIVHSDRGVQYAAGDFRQMLSDWSITPSMSRKGNCYDNAVSESFFATFKVELVYQRHYRTRAEAEADIFEYIEVFYNRVRLHSTVGYVSPAEFEQKWLDTTLADVESSTVDPKGCRVFEASNPLPKGVFSMVVDGGTVSTSFASISST